MGRETGADHAGASNGDRMPNPALENSRGGVRAMATIEPGVAPPARLML